jgi:hypothetical protein
MITVIRTLTIAPGRMGPAMAVVRETAAHLKRRHDLDFVVATPVGGNPLRISWIGQYADLAAVERALDAMSTDADLATLMVRNAENVVPGTTRDEIWRH